MSEMLARATVVDALYDAGLDEDALYEGYSGRGMLGADCFGIVGYVSDVTKFLIRLVAQDDEQGVDLAESLADSMRSDGMGTSTIFYFPGYEVEKK